MTSQLFYNGKSTNLAKGLNLPPFNSTKPLWFRYDEKSISFEFSSEEIADGLPIRLTDNDEFQRGFKNFAFVTRLFVQIVNSDDYSNSDDDLYYLTDTMVFTNNYIVNHLKRLYDLKAFYHHEVQSVMNHNLWYRFPHSDTHNFVLTTHIKIKKNYISRPLKLGHSTMSTFFNHSENQCLSDSTKTQIRQFFDQIELQIEKQQ